MITTGQAAIRKYCQPSTVREAIKRGELSAIREGKFLLIDEDSEQWKKWRPKTYRYHR